MTTAEINTDATIDGVLSTDAHVQSLIERLEYVSSDGLLRQVFLHRPQEMGDLIALEGQKGLKDQALEQYSRHWLNAYLNKEKIPFDTAYFFKWNVTDFRQAVWDEVSKIPFGQIRTYGDIAKAIGKPKAVRAVGTAIGRNPLFIFRPCHRVIASDGSIGGFALDTGIKRALLEHEGTYLSD